MDSVLQCTDVFGRRVVLRRRRWIEHILVDHAEMNSRLNLIEDAVTRPDLVNQDSNYGNRENFYLLSVAGTRANRHVKVCVEYEQDPASGRATGSIVTAYLTRSIKVSEVTTWRPDR